MGLIRFFRFGGRFAWILLLSVIVAIIGSSMLFANTLNVRYRRDVSRMVYNNNTGLLDQIRREIGEASDSLGRILSSGSPEGPPVDKPYLVVSIADHRLWYRLADSTVFTTQVATGSGKVLEKSGGGQHWRFETPRGRLVVQSKEQDPDWVPPDWHFVEQAQKRGLGIVRLNRGQSIATGEGMIAVEGNDVVRRLGDGKKVPIESGEGREIVANGNIIIPPYGTRQRKYRGVLGTFRLNIGDGYALHGTDQPQTIGHSVSHGCVRLRNEDIETLYNIVPIGTPVYIY
jgi:lipoprotein-anchoring transpeptidase ErfK/SrfK